MHLRKYSVVTTNRFHCMVKNAMHAIHTTRSHTIEPTGMKNYGFRSLASGATLT